MYLRPFCNEYSNAIETSIADILESLMTIYRVVSEEELRTAESALRERVFDITKPLVITFNEMNNLQELATAADLAYTPT